MADSSRPRLLMSGAVLAALALVAFWIARPSSEPVAHAERTLAAVAPAFDLGD